MCVCVCYGCVAEDQIDTVLKERLSQSSPLSSAAVTPVKNDTQSKSSLKYQRKKYTPQPSRSRSKRPAEETLLGHNEDSHAKIAAAVVAKRTRNDVVTVKCKKFSKCPKQDGHVGRCPGRTAGHPSVSSTAPMPLQEGGFVKCQKLESCPKQNKHLGRCRIHQEIFAATDDVSKHAKMPVVAGFVKCEKDTSCPKQNKHSGRCKTIHQNPTQPALGTTTSLNLPDAQFLIAGFTKCQKHTSCPKQNNHFGRCKAVHEATLQPGLPGIKSEAPPDIIPENAMDAAPPAQGHAAVLEEGSAQVMAPNPASVHTTLKQEPQESQEPQACVPVLANTEQQAPAFDAQEGLVTDMAASDNILSSGADASQMETHTEYTEARDPVLILLIDADTDAASEPPHHTTQALSSQTAASPLPTVDAESMDTSRERCVLLEDARPTNKKQRCAAEPAATAHTAESVLPAPDAVKEEAVSEGIAAPATIVPHWMQCKACGDFGISTCADESSLTWNCGCASVKDVRLVDAHWTRCITCNDFGLSTCADDSKWNCGCIKTEPLLRTVGKVQVLGEVAGATTGGTPSGSNAALEQVFEDEPCERCGRTDFETEMLLCDGCDKVLSCCGCVLLFHVLMYSMQHVGSRPTCLSVL